MPESITLFLEQAQSPTTGIIAWLLIVVSLASQLAIPDSAYVFTGFFLLVKLLLTGGIAIVDTDHSESFLPAIEAVLSGVTILLISRYSLDKFPDIKGLDAAAALRPLRATGQAKSSIEPSIHCYCSIGSCCRKTHESRFTGKPSISEITSDC